MIVDNRPIIWSGLYSVLSISCPIGIWYSLVVSPASQIKIAVFSSADTLMAKKRKIEKTDILVVYSQNRQSLEALKYRNVEILFIQSISVILSLTEITIWVNNISPPIVKHPIGDARGSRQMT